MTLVAQLTFQYWLVPVLVIVILGLWTRSRLERRPLIKLARQRGLSYRRRHQGALLDHYSELSTLQQGHSIRIIDVLSDPHGGLTAFRLIVELGSRTSRRLLHSFVVIRRVHTGLQLLRVGKDEREVQRCDPLTPTILEVCPNSGGVVVASKLDAPHVPHDELLKWVAQQPEQWCWQAAKEWVAGYGPFRARQDYLMHMIAATGQLADLLAVNPTSEQAPAVVGSPSVTD